MTRHVLAVEREARAAALAAVRERVEALRNPARSDVNYAKVAAILDDLSGDRT